MQSFTVAAFLLAFYVQSASADFVVKETVQNLGRNQDVTIKLKDNHCRIDANPETGICFQLGSIVIWAKSALVTRQTAEGALSKK